MASTSDAPTGSSSYAGRYQTFLTAAVGSVLLFAAQPPLGWSLLAWVAPLPWLWLSTQQQFAARRPNLQIWLAGVLYWLCTLHWVRLAHPATIVGLCVLASVLALYLLAFIRLTRLGVLALGLPVWIVAPLAWVACEWLQSHLFSGFLMGALGHTQVDFQNLVQIADVGGAYLVSMLIVFVASCVLTILKSLISSSDFLRRSDASQREEQVERPLTARGMAMPLVLAIAALAISLGYGKQRIASLDSMEKSDVHRIALVQGSHRAVWTSDPGRDQRVMDSYMKLTETAAAAGPDVIVWPEGMFRTLLYTFDATLSGQGTDGGTAEEYASYAPADLAATVQRFGSPLLVGIDRYHVSGPSDPDTGTGKGLLYNAAVAVDLNGEIIGTYDKNHRVMFGEYVPGGDWWPAIYNYFPIGGLTPGTSPAAFQLDGVRYMPTICFETVVPHVVRNQVAQLTANGQRPDVLVNLTNDSWFYDSSELEMHLTCTRFRAIECRTPVVVAANGGLSAHIDRAGRVVQVSQPMAEQVLIAEVSPGAADCFYARYGDLLPIGCLLATSIIAMMAILRLRQT